ncbi:MAG: PilN domain-containing protein [Deltaproteobacteria bacterium]|nr:PilN domain-containing protein [Deltaproteobacteria bacterium]
MIERINLIPIEVSQRLFIAKVRSVLVVALILYVLMLGVLYSYQKWVVAGVKSGINLLLDEKKGLINEHRRYQEILNKTRLLQKREGEIGKRVDIISGLVEYRLPWAELFVFLSNNIPKRVWLTSLASSEKQGDSLQKVLRFGGTALNNVSIADFIFILENSRYFDNVLLTYSQKREVEGEELFDFEITTVLKTD